MKKLIPLFSLAFLSCILAQAQTPFTPGNVVVYKIGNGEDTLSSAPFAVNIDEFEPSGTFVGSHPLPIVLNGANKRLVASGSATSEGMLSRSSDNHFLLITGYDTVPTPTRSSLSGSNATIINRVVGVMGSDGNVDVTTSLSDAYNGSNIRGAVSTNGTDIWISGTGSPVATAGVRYLTKGSTTSTQISTTVTNIRNLAIANEQLYCTTGSGAFKGVSAVGTGLPTTSGQTISVLPGFPNTSASGPDPYAFEINEAGTVAYVAEARSKLTGGGVQKWTNDGSTWSLAYTLDSGLTLGVRYLAVDWSTPQPTIYAVTSDPIVKNVPGNKLVKTIDSDSTAEFEILAQAEPNYVFRGVTFAPEGGTSITYTFTGTGNWSNAANWQGGTIPPNPLLSGTIVIDHTAGGNCLVDVSQVINQFGALVVKTGKNLIIPGSLSVN